MENDCEKQEETDGDTVRDAGTDGETVRDVGDVTATSSVYRLKRRGPVLDELRVAPTAWAMPDEKNSSSSSREGTSRVQEEHPKAAV